MKSGLKYVIFFFIGLSMGIAWKWFTQEPTPTKEGQEEKYSWTQEQAEEEMTAIYNLLATQAFTMRTNMNLALKTNHYLTHSKKDEKPALTCPECLKTYKEYVEGMPPLREGNKMYFDKFYREPLERYLEQNPKS